jgi:2-(1,2-epoxy-1,2-dihydrophenyl)acetyl-CoA isomerase
MSEHVVAERTEVDGPSPNGGGRQIARIAINRPSLRNALTRKTVQELRRAVDKASGDSNVRVIVLTGTGEGERAAFCAGADLRNGFSEDPGMFENLEFYLDDFHGLIRSIWNAPKPVVARVDGAAAGFGCDLALACDLRICSERAYFQESFTKIGLLPDGGGTFTLTRLVGLGIATELIFLTPKIDSKRAREIGIATRVVANDRLDEETNAIVKQLADGPPLALAEAKRALHASLGVSIDDVLARERAAQIKLLRSSDAMEGVMSFTQKRPPVFEGK